MVTLKILINASNLHGGGGVQVALSFLYELSLFEKVSDFNFDVVVSSEVSDGLIQMAVDITSFGQYDICDTFGIAAFTSRLNYRIRDYDVVFTVFGPNYLRVKAKKEVVGFAQSWILNFNNPISSSMSFMRRNILRLKFYLQWLFFLRSDHYIVELEHVKSDLISIRGLNFYDISVVHNTVSSLFLDDTLWLSTLVEKKSNQIALGIVTRDYPHKNIKILPLVANLLLHKYKLKVHFYTTLNDDEWATKDDFFKKYVSTVGSLSPVQCPSFYEQMDGVIFPSLLECFSACPLESLVMKKPLFASDRGFVHDICDKYATYFDPLDPDDIAQKIANYYTSEVSNVKHLDEARLHALSFSNARARANDYISIIKQVYKD